MVMPDGPMDDAALASFLKADAATIAAQIRAASPQDMEKLLLAVLLDRLPDRADPLADTSSRCQSYRTTKAPSRGHQKAAGHDNRTAASARHRRTE